MHTTILHLHARMGHTRSKEDKETILEGPTRNTKRSGSKGQQRVPTWVPQSVVKGVAKQWSTRKCQVSKEGFKSPQSPPASERQLATHRWTAHERFTATSEHVQDSNEDHTTTVNDDKAENQVERHHSDRGKGIWLGPFDRKKMCV